MNADAVSEVAEQNRGNSPRAALLGPYPAEPGKFRNGVESVVSALADGLAEHGVEVFVVTADPDIKKEMRSKTPSGVNVLRLPVYGKLGNLTGFAMDVKPIRAALDEIRPDIVHIHKILIYAKAAMIPRWKSVLTVHGIHFREAALQRGWAGVRARFACRYEREALRKARHVICLNRYAVETCGGWLKAPDVRLIDNPIDDGFFDVSIEEEQPGTILFGGSITRRKNVLGLLGALDILAKDYPEIRLKIAGKAADEAYYQRCLDFVAGHGLQENVEFLGSLSVDAMASELGRACMLVLPSRQESAPVIISEAMAAGKPVVATAAGGTAEMVEDGVSGFVTPINDAPALASAIGKLMNDADLRRKMGQAGKKCAESRFRRSVVVEKTIALYRDVIGEQ
ncbi:MAG: glycosyltransferase family 4 protein [Armatimonadetes bacterium]|jgi:glycosyltransferase involved in cell wall biosynthesis|nr:glycosyltransferase family 4 protein [Armatimonadota bacterium]